MSSTSPAPVEVLKQMVAMFDCGTSSEAAPVIADDYLDHQGLGDGPLGLELRIGRHAENKTADNLDSIKTDLRERLQGALFAVYQATVPQAVWLANLDSLEQAEAEPEIAAVRYPAWSVDELCGITIVETDDDNFDYDTVLQPGTYRLIRSAGPMTNTWNLNKQFRRPEPNRLTPEWEP